MSGKKRDLTEDETSLWRRVAAEVKPRQPASVAKRRAPDAAPAKSHATRAPAPHKPKPSTSVVRKNVPPADRGAERRVRRGKLDIDAELDLHGHTQDSGRAALMRFVQAAHRRGDRTLIVVTGAGRAGEGVLRRRLPDWLAELTPPVAGFAQAHRVHGGAGAFYVFLKRKA